jgi:hypothetical protein
MVAEASDTRGEARFQAQEVERVVADFQRHTLEAMEGMFNRLIYLASLRDYNTGHYHHYGLESRYSGAAVDEGLRQCHAQAFEALTARPLQEQTQDLLRFFESLKVDRSRLVEVWQRLRAYQMLPPEDCHPLARELFNRNTEIILEVLRATDLWELLDDPHRDPDHLP